MTNLPQHVLCGRGDHAWTDWGKWIAVTPSVTSIGFAPETIAPIYQPVEAYRHRSCICGIVECESLATGERKQFGKDDE